MLPSSHRPSPHGLTAALGILSLASSLLLPGLTATAADGPKPGERLDRKGDEIVVCGQLFHTTSPVVLWTDPGGYDAYRVPPHFGPPDKAKEGLPTTRFGVRKNGLSEPELARVQSGGWDLPLLQRVVDQFVIHYDVCGTSQRCFRVLHDDRGLSVHFMLDIDGTIYQTLDLKEAAWHATIANGRSIGIEIANMGAYPPGRTAALDRWYEKDAEGRVKIKLPGTPESNGIHNPDALLAPAHNELVKGEIRGQVLEQYDLTQAQYDALVKLTATLCTVFPKIKPDYPRDSAGVLRLDTLSRPEFDAYQGLLGHYHIQANKTDPGPAFQWDRLIDGVRSKTSGN
ncbi:N-acetylmuramoyl-L-alanine amidase [Planctomyces sp. SH-PL62]|uniref:N-acetylmuramoyl-L-alanine amidase n=1 Tax=Planctomyces sp. SH-PL62 TaxID=1636152 RepID=UPI00078BFAC8|nr:peptidoglycan recognition family protein [Planctomyces sp. SH-PL62]AMV39011.1 N-acetyl-anhydromuranmyl-L-alanine amidase [Planctomyces sp. SH-PL62]